VKLKIKMSDLEAHDLENILEKADLVEVYE